MVKSYIKESELSTGMEMAKKVRILSTEKQMKAKICTTSRRKEFDMIFEQQHLRLVCPSQ